MPGSAVSIRSSSPATPRHAERLVPLRLAADQVLEVAGGVVPAEAPERGAAEVMAVRRAQPDLPALLTHAPQRLVSRRGDERQVALGQRAQRILHDLVDHGPANRRIRLGEFVFDLAELKGVVGEELEGAGAVRLDAAPRSTEPAARPAPPA